MYLKWKKNTLKGQGLVNYFLGENSRAHESDRKGLQRSVLLEIDRKRFMANL